MDEKKRILSVNKCEVLILYGHQHPQKPWTFDFKEADGCAGAAGVICYPERTNKKIPSTYQIPGALLHDELIGWPGNNPSDAAKARREDRGPEQDAKKQFEDMRRNALKKAMDLCRQECCPKITIRYYRFANDLPIIGDRKHIPPRPDDEVLDCAKVRKSQ